MAILQELELLKLLLEFIFDNTVQPSLVQSALDVVSAVLNVSNNKVRLGWIEGEN